MSDLPVSDLWEALRGGSPARIGLGRAGDALPTSRVLEFQAAHALARDAVHQPLDVQLFSSAVAEAGLGPPVHVTSQASDRSEYLRRPDLGRAPRDLSMLAPSGAEVGIVICDGLSPRAVADHGVGLLLALVDELSSYSLAPLVVATQARVALGDHVGLALGVSTVLVVIGERPGLSAADSLGVYLTHEPRPGRTDAERNCISNIHPPDGLTYDAAARTAASLLAGARTLGRSGVDLKDRSRELGTAG